jgi:hypothetical protein
MSDDFTVNSAGKSDKKPRGKPFTGADDPRRHKTGRPRVPKSAVELNKLIDEIAAEEVENPVTHEQVQRIRAMLRSMMTGKDSRGKVHLLDRRYGKVPDKLEMNSDNKIELVVRYATDDKPTETP